MALFLADGVTPAVDVDGVAVANQTTVADGLYLFPNLAPGAYVVQVSAPAGYRSSTDIVGSLTPDSNTDDDDNGEGIANVVASRPITLTSHGEPTTPVDTDDTSGNLTLDFGFFQPLARLGNLVFEDVTNNGVYDSATDQPLVGAAVALFLADGVTPAVDADGVAVANQTTVADGLYLFPNLAPGAYVVQVSAPAGYRSSTDIGTSANPDTNTDHDDNGFL